MSYGDFSFTEVINSFNLITEESEGIFSDSKPKELSSLYQQTLADYLKFVSLSSSEKLRSEALVFPLLAELVKSAPTQLNIFSGCDFTVDPNRGLNGRCDFLITKSPEILAIRSPVIVVVEAKKSDLGEGLGQCLATMVAAQIFNGDPMRPVLGTITTGTIWIFLLLENNIVKIDLTEYSIKQADLILGILSSVVV
ncbi:MAG: hypothetical protein PUP93_31825 [Rhizonema sp. NSF051]|nr:hypothetical protein [Rhizonema sp. NSF051]